MVFSINTPESWLIYIAIFFIALFISDRKLNYLKLTVLCLFLMSASICLRQYDNFQEKKLIVYDTGKHHALAIRNGFLPISESGRRISQGLKISSDFMFTRVNCKLELPIFIQIVLEPDNQKELFERFPWIEGCHLGG